MPSTMVATTTTPSLLMATIRKMLTKWTITKVAILWELLLSSAKGWGTSVWLAAVVVSSEAMTAQSSARRQANLGDDCVPRGVWDAQTSVESVLRLPSSFRNFARVRGSSFVLTRLWFMLSMMKA
ncbi:hypothetical protein CYMTET_27109 [Cymbomonas tetramitiformis]|uniref:Uncharacterized protein n=1 Tax=Cymbomonas tetramitiformis TaxID=36881 RepID=A0AAE0FQD7_9CHLO|nr:hypothetical protein CYMTET_27109 [Cymbomonas tetramitiformis]